MRKYLKYFIVLIFLTIVVYLLISYKILNITTSDFNNIVTPLATILAAIIYLLTLLEIKRQNHTYIEDRKTDRFQSNFYTLLNIFENTKKSFTYNGKFGIEGFQEFRREFDVLKEKAQNMENVNQMIKTLFSRSSHTISGFPIRIFFEIIDLITKQEKDIKKFYKNIFASSITESERIYLFNYIHSGLLKVEEIPSNLNEFLWLYDKVKIFKIESNRLVINKYCFPNLS